MGTEFRNRIQALVQYILNGYLLITKFCDLVGKIPEQITFQNLGLVMGIFYLFIYINGKTVKKI